MNINFKTRQLIRSSSRGFLSTEFNPKNFKSLKTGLSKPFSYSTFVMTAFDYDLSPFSCCQICLSIQQTLLTIAQYH